MHTGQRGKALRIRGEGVVELGGDVEGGKNEGREEGSGGRVKGPPKGGYNVMDWVLKKNCEKRLVVNVVTVEEVPGVGCTRTRMDTSGYHSMLPGRGRGTSCHGLRGQLTSRQLPGSSSSFSLRK